MADCKSTIVMGLGNPLMADEGIGLAVVRRLADKGWAFEDVEFIDAGTGGMTVLHLIANRKKAVIVDCAFMGTAAGTIRRFERTDVTSVKKLAHHSLHESDILKVIDLATQLDQCPEQVVFFGIEPAQISLKPQLSEVLEKKLDEYCQAVARELNS